MLRGNGFYKLASVLVALALAVYVYGERNPTSSRLVTLPLKTTNQEPGVIVLDAPSSVQVKVTGPRDSISGISPRDLQAAVNLAGLQAGQHTLKVVAGPAPGIQLPADVDVQPRDETVGVRLAAIIRRTRPVEPVFLRPAPVGYSYGIPVVTPPVASISGPRDAVARVGRLEAVIDAFARPGRTLDGRFSVRAVDDAGMQVGGVRCYPESVRVRCEMQRMPGEKEVLVSPDVTGAVNPNYRVTGIQVTPQTIVVSGNPEVLARLNFVSTQEISIAGASQSLVRSVSILLPEGVTTQASRRARVDIEISPRQN